MEKLTALHNAVSDAGMRLQQGVDLVKTSLLVLCSVVLSASILITWPVSASPGVTEYPLSSPISRSFGPYGITTGSDNALWFAQPLLQAIGRISTSGNVTEYSVPTEGALGYVKVPHDITSGPDGALWFTAYSGVGRVSTSGSFSAYPLPADDLGGITTGPDGALWFTEMAGGNIGRITTSGAITEFHVPASPGYDSAHPYNITAGPDGALWFTTGTSNAIFRITTSGDITRYPSTINVPNGITRGPDGALWFTEYGYVGRITTAGSIVEYPLPEAGAQSARITSGSDGALWFTEENANYIGRVTTNGAISEYSIPTSDSESVGITTGPDNALWFAEWQKGQIGRIVPDLAPAPPTNLVVPSPAQYPGISWDAVSGATSYNIYRNGTNISSSSATSYTDNAAPESTNSYYVTAVSPGGESLPSSTVGVLVDRTAPSINADVSPAPINGWNNTGPVTLSFNCSDNTGGSGIANCPQPQSESSDGVYVLSGTAIDNAGNSSSTSVTVSLDQTAPTVSNVVLTTDPLAVNQTTTLNASVADNLSGIAKVEYFTGADPGQGNGVAMTLSNGSASAVVGPYSSAGMYTYFTRSEDNAGNWSIPKSVTLDVYNPSGGYTAGHGSVVPNGSTSNTNPSDSLPSQIGNNIRATFDFTLKYVTPTSTVPSGTSTFFWGSTCNNPHSDCFAVIMGTTVNPAIGSLSWLVVPGDNTATFQGTAMLRQGSASLGDGYPVRVTVTGTTITSPGHYVLEVFQTGANPDTALPRYQASGDLTGGAVVLHP